MDFEGTNSLAHLHVLHGEDELERALASVAPDAVLGREIMAQLLDASVYVFAPEEVLEGPVRPAAGSGVPALSWDRGNGRFVLPFFTSLRSMSRSFQGTARYIHIATRTVLLSADERMDILMNFGSPTAREFDAATVREILRAHPPHTQRNMRTR